MNLSQPVFFFRLDNQPADLFDVLRFEGHEGISDIYAFDILLLSDRADLDWSTLLADTGHLEIRPPFAPRGGLTYTGILASLEFLHRSGGRFVYRARLRHKLWWLSLVHHNRVFLDVTPIDACTKLLEEAGLHGPDFAWKNRSVPKVRDFFCQYEESDLAFLNRWLERLGLYYWFEQTDEGPTCVLADDAMAHPPSPGQATCDFVEPSGLNPENPGLVVTDFAARYTPCPKEVLLKTKNPQKPDLDLDCRAMVRADGRGTFYRYGDHYETRDEGQALADIEAQALLCHAETHSGTSHNPALRPGHTFTLRGHFRESWNRQYLTCTVRHEASQAAFLAREGLAAPGASGEHGLFYRNTFTCIPAAAQYRSLRTTPWPKVAGCLSARVDAQGSGDFAELDDQGRYKVVLPFDLESRGGGKASCWVRMMQPYAGEGMGLHAPLHKGTEVMLTFVDGDPDRPVIAAAVPNPVTPSTVTDANATQINLRSAAGQQLIFEDAPGREHILFSSPDGGAFIKIGVDE